MRIGSMKQFEEVCKEKLADWYNGKQNPLFKAPAIGVNDIFVVWSCKTLQNYKLLLGTEISGDGVYAEYTYNGDEGELYEDVYIKATNRCLYE